MTSLVYFGLVRWQYGVCGLGLGLALDVSGLGFGLC